MKTSRSIAGAARTSRTFWISSTIFPRPTTIRLEQNYRSTKNILAAAGAVVENNKARKGKKLWTEADAGDLIGLYAGYDAENEALFIADATEKYLAGNPNDHVAILYRTNSQSRQIEEALRRYGRKYNVVGGFSFYQRAEIKDTVAYLKLAAANSDSVSLMRVINTPARGIGRTTVEQIERYGRDNGLNLWDAIERIIDDQQLSDAIAIVAGDLPQPDPGIVAGGEHVAAARCAALHSGPHRLQEDAAAGKDAGIGNAAGEPGRVDQRRGGGRRSAARASAIFWITPRWWRTPMPTTRQAPVTLMTLHNAKGLEFPLVFLSGMELGLFPHSRSMNSAEVLEEERRLCYVGMTRARKRLILTWARYRRRFGGGEQERSTPSPFLERGAGGS